jgi:hypothetical protein
MKIQGRESNGDFKSPYKNVKDRILSNIEINDEECWIWQGKLDGNGYARTSYIRQDGYYRRSGYAHIASYLVFIGTYPLELKLDHLCRVPACVNPHHLEPVTQRENILRGLSCFAINVRKTHCVAGHEYTPENTFIRMVNGNPNRRCRTCKRESEKQSYKKKIGREPRHYIWKNSLV